MARPKANIDWEKVDKYLQAQCDGSGIAGLLGISPETLYRHCKEDHKIGFDAYSQQKKSEGKELLRSAQFKAAMTGNITMQIWLGKQYLDQKEKSEVRTEDISNNTLKVEIVPGAKPVNSESEIDLTRNT